MTFMDLEYAYDMIDRNAMWLGGKLLTVMHGVFPKPTSERACVRVWVCGFQSS